MTILPYSDVQIFEIQYFGPITAFSALIKCKNVELSLCEVSQKMSFRNRCQVLGAQGVINLSVPLAGGRDKVRLTKHVEIDYSRRWQMDHWRTLTSCYNNSPFFYHYAEGLHKVIFTVCKYLWELDYATTQWALRQLKWEGQIHTETNVNMVGETKTLPATVWKPANRSMAKIPVYPQVFNLPFERNLSIIDLLCNLGPETKKYLLNLSVTDQSD
jgi:WbqC-like protein family